MTTMISNNSNNGGRIAYASKTAAQLLGIGIKSPQNSHPRSPQMNHPIALKFSSNKQPLFPSRSKTISHLSSSTTYTKTNNTINSINPMIVRPHSSNEFNALNLHNAMNPSHVHPKSLPSTPKINIFPNTSNFHRSPNRNQMRRNQMQQQNIFDSVINQSINHLARTHPRSAHLSTSHYDTTPVKAQHNALHIVTNNAAAKSPNLNRRQTTSLIPNSNNQRRHIKSSQNLAIPQPNERPQSYHKIMSDDNPFNNNRETASNIRVVVRIRPLSDQERRDRCSYAIQMAPDQNPNSIVLSKKDKPKMFSFDKICHSDTSQKTFFEVCGVKPLINAALNGYATTLFAYGQTGSGKTFSVCGQSQNENRGIIPQTIEDLWQKIEDDERAYIVRCGYLEIYNERPRDLLNPHFKNLSIRWNSESGFFVENQCIVRCEAAEDLIAAFNEGESNRQTGSHELNTKSSRSHCLFTIHIESKHQHNSSSDDHNESAYVSNGKLSIVDLAGSEKLKDSKQQSDKGLRETANINRSLFTLGKVISTLEKVQSKELPSSTYIPYRDSVLTKLLMDSLGGSGMAIMIACVSPAAKYIDETLSTLYYASRARNIKNKPTKKINAKDRIIAQLIQEVQRLKTQNLKMRQFIFNNHGNGQQQVTQTNQQRQFQWKSPGGSGNNNNLTVPSDQNLPQQQPVQPLLSPPSRPRYSPRRNSISSVAGLRQMNNHQNHQNNNNIRVQQAFESLHIAKQSAEQQANHAQQQNFKLMDKIEHLERVFMQ